MATVVPVSPSNVGVGPVAMAISGSHLFFFFFLTSAVLLSLCPPVSLTGNDVISCFFSPAVVLSPLL